jgi:hypothetical protein
MIILELGLYPSSHITKYMYVFKAKTVTISQLKVTEFSTLSLLVNGVISTFFVWFFCALANQKWNKLHQGKKWLLLIEILLCSQNMRVSSFLVSLEMVVS